MKRKAATKPKLVVQTGWKVYRHEAEGDGAAEIGANPDKHNEIEIHYYVSPVRHVAERVPASKLRRGDLPSQTRVYHRDGKVWLNGRIIDREHIADKGNTRAYRVQFPNQDIRTLLETDFRVRSNRPADDPLDTLIDLAHETPFFFENRGAWIREYVRQVRLSGGMTGLLSARIDLFPHQVEVVRRVLQDPEIRYLLADEVGLGKTIEAGVILRQMKLDEPDARVGVFAPETIVVQWRQELRDRLDLTGIEVWPHETLAGRLPFYDAVVIDEAHKIVARKNATAAQRKLFGKVLKLCEITPHLLLLSATPVLNHEEELLALLHLLSPTVYDLHDLADFRQRIELRRELGRVLLALPGAKSGLALRQHLRKLAELLPNDPEVKHASSKLSAEATPDELRPLADGLHVHLSETYRLHRRMLRTRRSLLVEQGLVPAERVAYPPVIENDPRLPELWAELENWRSIVAPEMTGVSVAERRAAIDAYFGLALALATDRDLFRRTVESRLKEGAKNYEKPSLKRLAEIAKRPGLPGGRMETLRRFLDGQLFHEQHQNRRKYVVFCGDPEVCDWISQFCRQRSRGMGMELAHGKMSVDDRQASLNRFKRGLNSHVLLGDAAMEEGHNFQFAYRLVFFDLPFEPMRLEQRIGRLDRLNRLDNVHIHVLLTHADPNLALDAAWHEVLNKGLGVYGRSLADLQLLIDREMGQLREAAFEGGPSALLRQVPRLAAEVAKERQEAAEQDAIDGLFFGDLTAAPAYVHLGAADNAADDFGQALGDYWKKTMRLGIQRAHDRPKGILRYGRQDMVPLIPSDRFRAFEESANQPATVTRMLAVDNPDVGLLRPGNPFVAALRELADWDDRGRAFAMWRQAPGLHKPRFVFRVCVLTGLELPRLREPLRKAGFDQLAQANLLRLVNAWFPPRYDEVFLDEHGKPAEQELIDLCRDEYDNREDKNLSANRAAVLPELLGARKWAGICKCVRDEALEQVPQLADFKASQEQALRSAREHFQMLKSRLQARSGQTMESTQSLRKEQKTEDMLRLLVEEVIRSPGRRLDAIGVYVLSDKPVVDDEPVTAVAVPEKRPAKKKRK